MTPLLEFREVSKRYGRKAVLRRVSFAVQPGEIVGFVGPNGAGKTTALSIAVGLLRPSSGSGSLLGRPLGNAAARPRLGYLPDNPAFFAQSGSDAVQFVAKLQGIPASKLRDQVGAALADVSMANVRGDVRKFSRGQQQRVALAQALVNNPDLLILDEPTSALDPAAVMELRELLLAARAAGKGIFFSSHQLAEVERICDRILFLYDGEILRQGTVDELTLNTGVQVLTVRGLRLDSTCWREWRLQPRVHPMNGAQIEVEVPVERQRELIEKIWAAGGVLIEVTAQRQSLESLFTETGSILPANGGPRS